METKQKRTVIVSALALAGLLAFSLLGIAADRSSEPSPPPHQIVEALDDIYEAIVSNASDIPQREGYLKHYIVVPDSNETFFTVPDGKRFVLRKLFIPQCCGTLTVDDQVLIDWYYFADNYCVTDIDLPDGCVVVNAGETLKVVNMHDQRQSKITIVGYFCDAP